MLRTMTLAIASVAVISAAAFAGSHGDASLSLTDETTAQIRTMLAEQGYEVGKIKIEDGMYEAYARKDGNRYEVFLDSAFNIVEIEEDD